MMLMLLLLLRREWREKTILERKKSKKMRREFVTAIAATDGAVLYSSLHAAVASVADVRS